MNNVKVTIIDYGVGNICSVYSALTYLGANCLVTSSPSEVRLSDALILPGVGSFNSGMAEIKSLGLDDAILEAVKIKGRKILGICLGMQLMAHSGVEGGDTEGLGLFLASVDRFNFPMNSRLKIPHIGFNGVSSQDESMLFKRLPSVTDFYFVHSYRTLGLNLPGKRAVCSYGEDFLAAYECDNIFATQFHPEKSQTNGLLLLKNFLSI
jgi:glutamine amidotransferase